MLTDTSEWGGATLCEGRYRVLRKLGEGGMAHVYVARDDKLEREVVIKVPRSNLIHDGSFSGRFTREVRSLAKLAHPHVVPLIDIGVHDGVPFAVMHYLTGGSLRDRQPRGEDGHATPMKIDALHAWLPAIAQALDFVHKNKYIHRDVKPENILFDDEGQVFLSDLGIIKALTEPQSSSQLTALTGAGMILGTPHYMAPELIMGETVDGRVDQYALAVTLYEALTGQFPFTGSSAPAIFIQQTTAAPPSLRDVLPGVPGPLAAAVAKALAKSPRERFATCSEFVQAAIGVSSGSGSHAVAPTVMEKRIHKDPVMATLLEAGPRTETMSNFKNTTAATTAASPRQAAETQRSSRRWVVFGLAVVAAVAVGLAVAFWPRGVGELNVARVAPIALAPGGKQAVRVEIERQRLDGEAICWLEGLPDGVKSERLKLPADKSEGTIDLAIPTDATSKTVTATLKVKVRDIERSVPVEIAINAPVASLHFTPITPRTLKAGEIITVFLHVERKNCEGSVALSLGELPPGVTSNWSYVNSPAISADQSSYPLELKAAANAQAADNAKVIVTGKLRSHEAVGEMLLTVVPAPTPPKDPPPVIVKKPTPPPEPEPPRPPVTVPAIPPELILVPVLDVVLYAGERRTVWVQIERKNCEGPVAVGITGLPLNVGATVVPAVLESIPATRLALSFDLVAEPTATNTKFPLNINASLGNLRASVSFNVSVREVLWQKTDQLTVADPLDRVRTASRSKSFAVPLKAGKTYTIDMTSQAFDSYLRIETKDGVPLAQDDDSGGGLNARIVYTPEANGLYHIVATSFVEGKLGAFTLTIR